MSCLEAPCLDAGRGAPGHLFRGGIQRAGVVDPHDGAVAIQLPANDPADAPAGPDRLPGRDRPCLGQRMPLGGVISARGNRRVVITPDPYPVGAMRGSDLADQGIARLVVQFLEGRGFHHKPPFRGLGFNPAGLLSSDQKNNLAHTCCFGCSHGSTLPGSTPIGVLLGIRGSVIERAPAGLAAQPLAPAPQGWPPWQPET